MLSISAVVLRDLLNVVAFSLNIVSEELDKFTASVDSRCANCFFALSEFLPMEALLSKQK